MSEKPQHPRTRAVHHGIRRSQGAQCVQCRPFDRGRHFADGVPAPAQ